ncbi:hypothetical protein ERD32_01970 [Lactobacillus crispatus]|uniref:Uncharacterized protein n=1 Tax=Lactobacillus crispatus TaxID=47770 RepID=A0A4Q0LWI4_9LACO|nr:hypothetical protein [Lactobacillus crispatus]RXF59490.1 hypothetical protein ERD32_01970 [Lactobacillus crispatus]
MVDKEEKEKLTEALKEYIGEDVGGIECCYGEDLQEHGRRITIITKPHKPTFKVNKSLSCSNVIYIRYSCGPFCELYLDGSINLHGICIDTKMMLKVMGTILGFVWNLKQLKERYKDD